MTPDLDRLLLSRYPQIFPTGDLPPRSGVGNGWFHLLDTLCEQLQFWTDHNGAPQVQALQVKEKFAALAFYARGPNELQQGMVRLAGAISLQTCEVCGHPGWMVVECGWHRARCAAHRDRRTSDPVPVLYLLSGQGSEHEIGQVAVGGTPAVTLAEADAAALLRAVRKAGFEELQIVRLRDLTELPPRLAE